MEITKDIRYSKVGGARGTIDRYRPARLASGRPPVLFIHGGGWQNLSKEGMAPIARWMAEVMQVEVWCPNYRLLPGAAWPAPLDDCKAAARHVIEASGSSSLVVGGGSAGAHLAMLTGFELPHSRIHGILSYGGPAVLEQRGRPVRPLFKAHSMQRLFGKRYFEKEMRTRLCPAWHQGAAPPLALVHSRKDLLVMPSHARLMELCYRRNTALCRRFDFDGYGINHGGWAIRQKKNAAPALARPFKDALHRALRYLYLSCIPHGTPT